MCGVAGCVSVGVVEEPGGIPCVVYAAKSTADRRGSIPEQLRECRESVRADPRRRLVAEYSDEAFSAYRRDRGPGLLDATQHCEDLAVEHGVAELWAQHSDRLARGDGRRARHTVELALWALKHDVRIRTLQDPDTFRDLLYAVVTGQRNNEDSKRKALSSQAGRRRAIARGEFIGHLPDGYLLELEIDEHGKLCKRMVIDPEREPVIAMMFRLALRGRSCRQIAVALNSRGWQTKAIRRIDRPRPFDGGKVYELLLNARYAGLATYRGEVLARGHWPAYVSECQQIRIVQRLRAPRPTSPRRQIEPYLLEGVVWCRRCGARLRKVTGNLRDDGTVSRAYVCARHLTGCGPNKCAQPPLDAHTAEAMLIASLPTLLATVEPAGPPRRTAPSVTDTTAARLRLRQALQVDDERAIDQASEELFCARHPAAALMRETTLSQRRARELKDTQTFRRWIEEEATGRTPSTREQNRQLNALLRGWFDAITFDIQPKTITVTATRRHGTGGESPAVEVVIDRIAWARSKPAGPRRMIRYGAWTRIEIIATMQAWAQEHGRSPEWADWLHAGAGQPNSLTVRAHFGTWNKALRAAGLKTVPWPQPRPREWGRLEGVKALQAWARKHGRPPRPMEWAHATREHPCATTVREHFSTWQAALNAAGLQPQPRPPHRATPWAPADILTALQQWAAQHGRAPVAFDWITATREHPCAATVRNRYGAWNEALAAAGLNRAAP